MSTLYYESSFAHHGVKGMKWGVRRYQKPDGTLTLRGRHHYLRPDGNFTTAGRVETQARTTGALNKNNRLISEEHRKELDSAYNEYAKVVSPINKLMADPKLVRKFGSESLKLFLKDKNSSPDESALRDYVGSDADYGPNSTVALYYKSNGVPYAKLQKDYRKAFDGVVDSASKVANDILNSFGDKAVSKLASPGSNAYRDTELYTANLITKSAFKTMRFNWD